MNTSSQTDTNRNIQLTYERRTVCTICTPQPASIVNVSIYVCIYFSFSFSESKFQHLKEVKLDAMQCNCSHTVLPTHNKEAQ